jgi:recombination protein RecR
LAGYERSGGGEVGEVVIATNPTTTGEATPLHLAEGLRAAVPDVTVTRLASGLPVGADLEYPDEVTLGRAGGTPGAYRGGATLRL